MTSSASPSALTVGMVLFPDVTQLDVTGPYEVFARMPATKVHLVAATLAPVRSEHGLSIVPDLTFDTAPPFDVICVPGGLGVNAAMEDEALLAFLQRQARDARYLTSVCTGALIVGAAGLLRGYRATTHWLSLGLLPLFGAHPVEQRIVIDRNRITGGGVTAGIDLGLVVASKLLDAAVAQEIQLMIQYSPAPPYNAGSPSVAPADVVQTVVRTRQQVQSDRRIVAERAAARLDHGAGGANGRPMQAPRRPRPCHSPACGYVTSEDVFFGSTETGGVAINSLAPGTTLVVHTRNSQYRLVILFDQPIVLVKGGDMFPEPAVVRLEGASAGGSALKAGWILVGFHMEIRRGGVRIRSSRVRSVSIENVPALWMRHWRVRA